MNTNALRDKVLSSHLLTEQERQYWLGNLPRMTSEQMMKLDRILTEAMGIPWGEHMQKYLDIVQRGTQTLQAVAA